MFVKYKKAVLCIAPIVWLVAMTGMILCLLYSNRHWNETYFRTFYARWDFFIAYLLESIGIALFFIAFLISAGKSGGVLRKVLSAVSLSGLCMGILAVVITVSLNCIGLERVVRDYDLDCQLESDDQESFYEAVDSLIPQCGKVSFHLAEPNQYVLKAARGGYPKAQNAMGCFFHNRALRACSKAEYEGRGPLHHNLINQSETDFEHAIYWFLKAAQNDYGVSQTNLGRIFMGDLASDRQPDVEIARQWLLKAVQNGDNDAYYYLGKIYSGENLRDAYVYWSKGAEAGDEDCARELEKPEFAMGMPADSPVARPAVADTVLSD